MACRISNDNAEAQIDERVQVNGLSSRPDLEGYIGRVAGLDHKTKRVGIRLDNDSVIYVLIDRLTPLDFDDD